MNQKSLQTTLALLLASAFSTLGAVRYVNLNSTNATPPYTSWATAAQVIQDAVDVANPGDQVLVTNGVYQTGGRPVDGAVLTNRVAVTKPLLLQSANGPEVTIIQGYQVPDTTNGPAAVRCVYLTNGAMLVGFTLSGGATLAKATYYSNYYDGYAVDGGGVLCESLSAVVSNCVLTGNSATSLGGGAFRGTFDNCIFENNTSSLGGGVTGAGGSGFLGVLNHCTFKNNHGALGGGAHLCVLSNCTFTGNAVAASGGGAFGGQLYNCMLTNNSASNGGGAYEAFLVNCTLVGNSAGTGGGVSSSMAGNCLLLGNFASNGGGVSSSTLSHCILAGNYAAYAGGGSYQGSLDHCTLITNVADWCGGGAYGGKLQNSLVISNTAAVSGGGAYGDSSPLQSPLCSLQNCTVVGNRAGTDGGGVYASMLTNCIVYNNYAPSDANYLWGSLQYCCTTPLPESGEGNLTAAPLFVDPSAGNLRLQSNSPCVNAGYFLSFPDNLDLDGNPRLVDSAIDLGAYEYQGPPLTPFQAWLKSYGLATDGSEDYTDPDADGMNNWKEWRCGTIPTNALSVLKLLSASRTGSGVILAWQSVTNRTYLIERGTGSGTHITFVPVATNLAGQENLTTYTDPSAPGNGPVFYRVGVPE